MDDFLSKNLYNHCHPGNINDQYNQSTSTNHGFMYRQKLNDSNPLQVVYFKGRKMVKTKLTLCALALTLCGISSIHADVILIQEDFSGAAATSLDGVTASGTLGGTWDAGTLYNADGSVDVAAGNQSSHIELGSAINAFKGSADGLFELTATLSRPTSGAWHSFGFSQLADPSHTQNFLGTPQGVGSAILRSTGELDFWAGNGFTPNGLNPSGNDNTVDGPNNLPGDRTVTIEIDLRNHNGTTDFGTVTFFDSVLGDLGGYNYTNVENPNNQGGTNTETDPNWESILLSKPGNSNGGISNLTLTQITAVPEPSSLALLGLGSLVMVARRRK